MPHGGFDVVAENPGVNHVSGWVEKPSVNEEDGEGARGERQAAAGEKRGQLADPEGNALHRKKNSCGCGPSPGSYR